MVSGNVVRIEASATKTGENEMNDQAATNEWTDQDEADWQALQDDANEEYEQSVCSRYASRDKANLY
jgi:hypothetical protein